MIISLLLYLWCAYQPTDKTTIYIEQYQDIAIHEMKRTGIPASIKMAQAIHESGSGSSQLALNSNNHFGIKCKSYWKGKKYYHKDDDYDPKGKLISSCFRVYSEVIDSYVDHSSFILDNPIYSRIVQKAQGDYTIWVQALQHYGYATDPDYADKLLRIINSHQLYILDEQ